MQVISRITNISVALPSPIALSGGGVVRLVRIGTCRIGVACTFTAAVAPQALASNAALSLTGLQDGLNTLHILELHITPLQSAEYLRNQSTGTSFRLGLMS